MDVKRDLLLSNNCVSYRVLRKMSGPEKNAVKLRILYKELRDS
jgi:hypothetical protein